MTMITLFAKTAHTKEGKPFIRYIARLAKKDGTFVSAVVRTTGAAADLKTLDFPANIDFEKKDANLSSHSFKRNDGTEGTSYTLWLKAWKPSDEKYVDHSLDDFA